MNWEALPYGVATREVQGMFPGGNLEDWWLGTAYDRADDQRPWRPMDAWLHDLRARELGRWTADDGLYEHLVSEQPNSPDRAGGTTGLELAYPFFRSRLVQVGERAIEAERRIHERIAQARRR